MPIANIIDRRKRTYCSCPIYVVIEPSCTDNSEPHADQYDPDDPNINTIFEEMGDTSIYLAISWANRFKFPVTLYLYDGELDVDQEAKLNQAAHELAECFNRLEEEENHGKD